MSTLPPSRDPDTQPIPKVVLSERKRAAAVLAILAVVAAVVVGVIYLLGSSGDSGGTSTARSPGGPAVTVTGGAPSTTSSARSTPTSTKASTTPATGPRTGPVSCPTSAPCALPDDIGDVVGALNSYRAAHGKAAVTGSVTKAAKQCAVQNGDGSSCTNGYFWEPVGRSGTQVITKIASGGRGGPGWLVDPKMTKVQVGWAYLPSSKSFECVVISNA